MPNQILHAARAPPGFSLLFGIIRDAALWRLCRVRHKRHAYATHQLEHGLPVHELQRLLGHGNLQSTLRYVHWVPGHRHSSQSHADLIGEAS